jgi:hypothetical protein
LTTLRAVIQFWLADGGKHLITKCKNSLSDLNSTHSWWANARGGAGVSSNERYEALVDAEMRVHTENIGHEFTLAPGVAPDFKAFATAVDATVQLPF